MRVLLVRTEDGEWSLTADGQVVGVWSNHADACVAALEAWVAGEGGGAEGPRPRFRLEFLEGEETCDFRFIDVGAIAFDREPPWPFMFTKARGSGHDGSVLVGVIESGSRSGDSTLRFEGRFDNLDQNADATEAVRLLREGMMAAWSPDIGKPVGDLECTQMDDDGFCQQFVEHLTSGLFLGGTMVPFQALDSATITLLEDASNEAPEPEPEVERPAAATAIVREREPVVASVATVEWAPPGELFEVEEPGTLQPVTIDVVSGAVYGHLAAWNVCHTGIRDRCVLAPRSQLNYGAFHVGSVLTAEGEALRVGRLTAGTGHADLRVAEGEARAHYDNTGSPWAAVRATDGALGIWVSGALFPDVEDSVLYRVRACALSGDWRQVAGSLELVAALSVPVPGFPLVASGAVPATLATRAAFEGEECLALVAAGAFAVELSRGDPRITALETEVNELRAWRARVAPVVELLTPDAIARLAASITVS